MKDYTNIFGIDLQKMEQEAYERRQRQIREWEIQGRCTLCGGDHSKDKALPAELDCPHCLERVTFKVKPHCSGGVSYGINRRCSKCRKKVFLVVYWDGGVSISKS